MKNTNQSGALKDTNPMHNLTDAELVKIVEGTENRNAALTALMNRHQKDLERICMHVLHNADWVEDACEDTWTKMLVSLAKHEYKENARFARWLSYRLHFVGELGETGKTLRPSPVDFNNG